MAKVKTHSICIVFESVECESRFDSRALYSIFDAS